MDSCHIFNFLFSTKKATSGLTRCFATLSQQATASRKKNSKAEKQSQTNREAPISPLKQLQIKIVSLASGSKGSRGSNQKPVTCIHPKDSSCDTQCGTYKAQLVNCYDCDVVASSTVHLIDNPAAERTDKIEDKIDIDFQKPLVQEVEELGNETESLPQSGLSSQPMSFEQNLDLNDSNNASSSNSNFATYKRIILYDNQAHDEESEEPIISKSPEVFTMVTELGESRARLKRVTKQNLQESSCLDENNNCVSHPDFNTDCQHSSASSALPARDRRNVYVRNLVQSFETSSRVSIETVDPVVNKSARKSIGTFVSPVTTQIISSKSTNKPTTIVKPMPPKTPPKSNKAKYLNFQIHLKKPTKIEQLFQDESFLIKLFDKLEPLDRCVAAQVCRKWRRILYADQKYWKDLVNVIDCTQLRRDQLVECILNTIQSAKLKQTRLSDQVATIQSTNNQNSSILFSLKQVVSTKSAGNVPNKTTTVNFASETGSHHQTVTMSRSTHRNLCEIDSRSLSNNSCDLNRMDSIDSTFLEQLDQDDIWRIQELCTRYTNRNSNIHSSRATQQVPNQTHAENNQMNTNNMDQQQQSVVCLASKSSSIPSQISSTFSSVSLSSLLSPVSESSRIDSIKEKLYTSIDERGFDAICLYGATDEDIEDLVGKMPQGSHSKIIVGRLNNCSVTDRGLDIFLSAFNCFEELELSGCNEITNGIDLKKLPKLKNLIVTDCFNIADSFAHRLLQIMGQLQQLTIQAYHLTDDFIEHLSLNADTSRLTRLDLLDCKELTNQSLVIIAKHLSHLESLSLSGSKMISDDGIEVLVARTLNLRSLDLSWCSGITDASLECIACDLGETLTDLILDRNIHITNNGLIYLATMSKLTLLHIRWCPRISDVGLEAILAIKTLSYLSIAGLHQLTARSLLCLADTDLLKVELTNCPAVNNDLLMFLNTRMPKCNIIF